MGSLCLHLEIGWVFGLPQYTDCGRSDRVSSQWVIKGTGFGVGIRTSHAERRETHTGASLLLCVLLFLSIRLRFLGSCVPPPNPPARGLSAAEGRAEPCESYDPSSFGWELAGKQHLLSAYYVRATMLVMPHTPSRPCSSPLW